MSTSLPHERAIEYSDLTTSVASRAPPLAVGVVSVRAASAALIWFTTGGHAAPLVLSTSAPPLDKRYEHTREPVRRRGAQMGLGDSSQQHHKEREEVL